MNEYIIKLFPPSGRGMTLVFQHYRHYKIPRETPSAWALSTQGWEKFAISTKIAVTMETVRDRPMDH